MWMNFWISFLRLAVQWHSDNAMLLAGRNLPACCNIILDIENDKEKCPFMHKKILAGLLAIMMTASILSCGNKDKNKVNETLSAGSQIEASTDREETSVQDETSTQEESSGQDEASIKDEASTKEEEIVETQEIVIEIEGMTISQGVGELPEDFRDVTESEQEQSSVSDDNSSSESVTETENPETEPPVSGKDPASYTYEEFLAMSSAEQQAHFEQFTAIEAYFAWYNSAKAEYEANDDSIIIDGSGNIDIGDLMGQ